MRPIAHCSAGCAQAGGFWLPEAVVSLLFCGGVFVFSPMNHDAAWYMIAARRFLEGDRVYVDIFDTIPPLIIWLSSGPVLIGQLLPMSDAAALHSFVAGTLLFSGLLAIHILRFAAPVHRGLSSSVIASFAVALAVLSPSQMAQAGAIPSCQDRRAGPDA